MTIRPIARALLLVSVVMLATRARADAPISESNQSAKQHFEEGSKAFALGEFARAITEYKAAYNVKPDPVFLYNIAQSYRLANDLPQALFFYKSFLTNMPNAPNRRDVERRIRETELQLSKQHEVTTSPPNNVAVPGTAPTVEPTPPPEPVTPATTPTPSSTAPIVEPTHADAALTASPVHKTPVYKKWWLWTSVGVVVVGVGLGVGLGLGLSQGNAAPGSHFGTSKVF